MSFSFQENITPPLMVSFGISFGTLLDTRIMFGYTVKGEEDLRDSSSLSSDDFVISS